MRCRHRFQYYKSTLQTKECDAAREARAKAISILQKYSSNKWKIKTFRKLRLNFNTTKVLFKRENRSADARCRYQFQYYKSTLQTKNQQHKRMMMIRISILQKYSSNISNPLAKGIVETYFNTTKVLFKQF